MRGDDAWERREVQRFYTLRNALEHMGSMKNTFHAVFAEVVRSDSWSFFAIRHVRDYYLDNDWSFLTQNPDKADAIVRHHKEQIGRHAQRLAQELVRTVSGTFEQTNGNPLKENPSIWKNVEGVLIEAHGIMEDHEVADPSLRSAVQSRLLYLKSMVDEGAPLPELGKRRLEKALPPSSSEKEDRRSRYHLTESWAAVGNAQLALMKALLALDYGSRKRGSTQERRDADSPDLSLEITALQETFVVADAQTHRDLETAQSTLYRALVL